MFAAGRRSGGELLALESPVELNALRAGEVIRLLAKDVVLGEAVLGSGQVKLGDKSQPYRHGMLAVPLLVGGAQV